ncbi:MAG TPA: aspartyl protease family protein, partial [Thermoanaerobaculia bacterium]|nr:aspartyl protease family protein [Thermoanaerobaculia bacterium]
PFVTATLRYAGRELFLEQVLLDTGSGGSVFAADDVVRLGLLPEPEDPIQRVRGIGGTEYVFSKRLDALLLGPMRVDAFACGS